MENRRYYSSSVHIEKEIDGRLMSHFQVGGVNEFILNCLGGKRDPEDVDDKVTAERETLEEIGLKLTPENSIYCGGLDQRLVSTSGSTIPLMVLCPYGMHFLMRLNLVYVLTSPVIPTLKLQPTEVLLSKGFLTSDRQCPLRLVGTLAFAYLSYLRIYQHFCKINATRPSISSEVPASHARRYEILCNQVASDNECPARCPTSSAPSLGFNIRCDLF